MGHIKENMEDWNRSGRPAGGPDKLWDMYTKRRLMEGVLIDFMSRKEIVELWKKGLEKSKKMAA